jgi:hypothetical protein
MIARSLVNVVGALVMVMGVAAPVSASAPVINGFDFDNGNAFTDVMIPEVAPAILAVSPGGNDASLVLRFTTLLDTGLFDAIAPYHPTAVGVYSRLGRRPAEERTNRNKNVAMLHAAYQVLNSVLPANATRWHAMLTSVGLDPDDERTDTRTAVGLGNLAGNAVVRARLNDGMNQLGNEGGRVYNPVPYADYTGYAPVNTRTKLRDPSRWQPLLVTEPGGRLREQVFVTPQWARTLPYSYDRSQLARFRLPPPTKSNPKLDPAGYRAQADEVLAVSASLTDEQKALAELFDNKLTSLGLSQFFISTTRGHDLDQFIQLAFLTNVAAFDAGIAIWDNKVHYDAVRPVSAISHLYGDRRVTAWGGPGRGTVRDITGNQWRGYLNTADHADYPSGSAGFCAAHAQAMRRFLRSDELGWSVPVARGSSRIEPGVTPASDIAVSFPTWSQFEYLCGQSRLYGGVHFQPAIDAIKPVGHRIGDRAYGFVKAHIDGTAQ